MAGRVVTKTFLTRPDHPVAAPKQPIKRGRARLPVLLFLKVGESQLSAQPPKITAALRAAPLPLHSVESAGELCRNVRERLELARWFRTGGIDRGRVEHRRRVDHAARLHGDVQVVAVPRN